MKKTNETQTVYPVSLNEIIFAQKNKAYGAYALRMNYAKHMTAAMFLSLSIFIAFSVLSIILNHPEVPKSTDVPGKKEIVLEYFSPNTETQVDNVKPSEPIKTIKQSTVRYIAPIVTEDGAADSELPPTAEDLKKSEPWILTQKGNSTGIDLTSIKLILPAEPVKESAPQEPEETAVMFAEKMPCYHGGESELLSFIRNNVNYPALAIKAEVEGRVMVQFIVEKDGSVSNISVVKGIGAGCDEEAVRVCRLMNGWEPGIQNGKAVRVRMVIPFVFRLN